MSEKNIDWYSGGKGATAILKNGGRLNIHWMGVNTFVVYTYYVEFEGDKARYEYGEDGYCHAHPHMSIAAIRPIPFRSIKRAKRRFAAWVKGKIYEAAS